MGAKVVYFLSFEIKFVRFSETVGVDKYENAWSII